MKKILSGFCLLLFVAGCNPSKQDKIIGTWHSILQNGATDVSNTNLTFYKNNDIMVNVGEHQFRGGYKINGDELIWTLNTGISEHTNIVSLSSDRLELKSIVDGKSIDLVYTKIQ